MRALHSCSSAALSSWSTVRDSPFAGGGTKSCRGEEGEQMEHARSWETGDPKVDEYGRALIAAAAQARMPQLFNDGRESLYRQQRNGVSVIVVPTAGLSEAELTAIMAYRLAQYLAVHFVDPRMIYEARMEHEPISRVSPRDLHFLAGSSQTGEILCYATLEAGPEFPAGSTLKTLERPLFPVEQVHGW